MPLGPSEKGELELVCRKKSPRVPGGQQSIPILTVSSGSELNQSLGAAAKNAENSGLAILSAYR